MRAQNRLSAQIVKTALVGKHCDGAGLWLVKRDDRWAQRVQRLTVHGTRREMGLGGLPAISLAAVRKIGERWRKVAAKGRDPIKEREAKERAARREDNSLATVTADAFEVRKVELKGDGMAGRWLSPLNTHVLPKLGKVAVTDLDHRDISVALPSTGHARPRHDYPRPLKRRNSISQHGSSFDCAATTGIWCRKDAIRPKSSDMSTALGAGCRKR